MKSRIPVRANIGASLISSPAIKSIIPVGTWWQFEHYRKGNLIDKWDQKNVLTTEGLNHMLDSTFYGSTQITAWYMGLFESDTTPLITHTYAVPGFTESTHYEEATRVAYTEAAASACVTTNNASKAAFTIAATTSGTVYGAFLCGGGSAATTKEDTAGGGTLFASSKFATAKTVVHDDVLLVVCSITLADA